MEVLGFGALWLAVIWLDPSSWPGKVVDLTLNLLVAMVGHLGGEPFPRSWAIRRFPRHVGTSPFHAGHHSGGRGNFGVSSPIRDRLFGTLHPGGLRVRLRWGRIDATVLPACPVGHA